MPIQLTTISEEGFAATTAIRNQEVTVDLDQEQAPDSLETLLATYASCYVPAFRVGGRQRGVDELGTIEIDVTGEKNDDDKLESISFAIDVDADLDDETAGKIVERANELCKVHDALKSSLHADVTVNT